MPARVALRPRDTDQACAPNTPTKAWLNNYGQAVDFTEIAPILVTLLGTLGVGSVIGQYLSGGQQRREVRSRVLSALERVEDARWASEEATYRQFREAVQQLESAALVARVRRRVVSEYIFLAHVAWRVSVDDWDNNPGLDEGRGGVPAHFSNEVNGAAGDVARCVWHPWVGLIGLKRGAAKRKDRIDALESQRVNEQIESAKKQLNKRH